MTDHVHDVAIVGCGPVGGVLAALLGRSGRDVVVVERHPEPYQLPRAVHFDHEAARILQSCGLGDALPGISESGSEYEWRNASGQVLLRFGGRPNGPSSWPDANMFWQPALEQLIEQAAIGQPTVEVRRGWNVVGLDDPSLASEAGSDPDGSAATLTVESGDGGARAHVRARYVVGCDGANSTVRDLVGIGVTDLGFFYDWLIVDVALHRPRTFDPINIQVCDPARPTTAVSGGPGRRRWEFMRLPDETIAELDDPAQAWELLRPWDVTPDDAVLERHAVYRFQARWADPWRRGRTLLAGDAAHQMPPFAGQGMCSGLRDAANLAWKLDLVLDGDAPITLLDAYERERSANVRSVIDFSMSLGKVICVTDPEEARTRDELMVGGVAGGETNSPPPLPGVTSGVIREGDPVAGSLFPQGRVTAGDRVVRFDDAEGAGWRLVAVEGAVVPSLPDDLANWFARIGGAVVTVGAARDADATYADWFAAHGAVAALQRPDFHLYGAATEVADVTSLVASLRDALADPPPPAGPDRTAPNGGTP